MSFEMYFFSYFIATCGVQQSSKCISMYLLTIRSLFTISELALKKGSRETLLNLSYSTRKHKVIVFFHIFHFVLYFYSFHNECQHRPVKNRKVFAYHNYKIPMSKEVLHWNFSSSAKPKFLRSAMYCTVHQLMDLLFHPFGYNCYGNLLPFLTICKSTAKMLYGWHNFG